MDKHCDVVAEILFSVEKISNTLRSVAGKKPQDCGFSRWRVPALEESLSAIAEFLEEINESLATIFSEKVLDK